MSTCRSIRRCLNLGVFFALPLSGCAMGDAAGNAVTVRDSAGVEIVDVPGAALAALPNWTLAGSPRLSIGRVEGEDAYLFTAINGHTNVAVLSDGTLAITDGVGSSGSREVRLFDSSGTYLRKIGRAGEGPGEFTTAPNLQAHAGGGVVAYEQGRSRRVSIYNLDGSAGDTWLAPRSNECPRVPCATLGGVLASGVPVVTYQEVPRGDSTNVGQTFTDLDFVFSLGTRTGYLKIDSVIGPPVRIYTGTFRDGRKIYSAREPTYPVIEPEIVAGSDHAAVVRPDVGEIHLIDGTGKLVRIVRFARPAEPFTKEEGDEIVAAETARMSAAAQVEGRTLAPKKPAIGYVRFGQNDDLWVWDYRYQREGAAPEPDHVTIFGLDGRPVARLELRADPLFGDQKRTNRYEAISSRDVFRAVTEDALGVQRLVGFEILKNPPPER
jgi:hypothetical protein